MLSPAILLAGTLLDAALRATVERVCTNARTTLHSLEDACSSNLPVGARPCLIISLLPMGERRVPTEVSDAVTNHFPGLPILLLCQEQLTRPTVSVEEGRVILIGQPFTDEKLGAHIRSIVESLPPITSKPRSEAVVRRNPAKIVRSTSTPRTEGASTWKTVALVLGVIVLAAGIYVLANILSAAPAGKIATAKPLEKIPEQTVEIPKIEPKEVPSALDGRKPVAVVAEKEFSLPAVMNLELVSGESLALCLIPKGKFQMGSPLDEVGRDDDDERPHTVTIDRPFYLSKFEMPQSVYAAVTGMNPSQFKDPRRPVDTVSYFDAVEFCEKAKGRSGKNIRLPLEAEWEYACRAGTQTTFSFGETLSDEQANVDGNVPGSLRQHETVMVGSYAPNAFGLFDMHGNVWEWCQASTDKNAMQVLRGGAWSVSARHARSGNRHLYQPGGKNADFGFRIVVEIPELTTNRSAKSK